MLTDLAPQYNWVYDSRGGFEINSIGSRKAVEAIVNLLDVECSAFVPVLEEKLPGMAGNFALIVETSDWVLAIADKVRSYPIFYVNFANRFEISNSAEQLKGKNTNLRVDRLSLQELKTSGYVTGRQTLFENLYQLRAGEFLVWNKKTEQLSLKRYFTFYSEEISTRTENDLFDELEALTNASFQGTIDEAAGRPIWVPLSAGLDSRLVLCKLKQLGYDNIKTFSYGPPGNHDAKWAKYVAERLGVPWTFVPYRHREVREFFWSETRKKYWQFSSHYSALPFMPDLQAVHTLTSSGIMGSNSMIVNGQSGDFISGGHIHGHHIPYLEQGTKYSRQLLTDAVLKKHFTLCDSIRDQFKSELTDKILEICRPDSDELDRDRLSKLYELWEWQERQSKFVVSGQRVYDFFGLGWSLPLWSSGYLSFWQKIGYEYKVDQHLYKKYLETFDFFSLFRDFKPVVWNWQRSAMMVVPMAKLVQLLLGQEAKRDFYRICGYWGRYSNYYAPFGFLYNLKRSRHCSTPLTYLMDQYVAEYKAELHE